MQEDAEKFADEDAKKKELVDKRNEAETCNIQCRKIFERIY
jgi:molecular chaperone DnaK (HSP70)